MGRSREEWAGAGRSGEERVGVGRSGEEWGGVELFLDVIKQFGYVILT